ncbi:MAG: YDG domain-containing protein [Paludibacter sp.]
MKKLFILFCFIAGLTSLNAQTLIQKFYFDFGVAADSTKFDAAGNNGNYWNNYTGVNANFQTRRLVNSSNAVTNYHLYPKNRTSTYMFVGVNGPNFGPNTNTAALGDLGIANATTSTMYNNAASATGAQLTFNGLNPARRYKFYIFGSRKDVYRVNRYTLTGTTTYTDTLTIGYALANANSGNASGAGVTYNNTRIVQSGLIYPKADSITLAVTMFTGTTACYINCMKMEEYKGTQTITFGSLPTKVVGDADFAPGATASSALAVSYASSNTAVATIVSRQIHIVGAGTTTITASQSGDATYEAATSVPQTLTVSGAALTAQTITFGALSAKTTGDAPFDLTATASSGLTVSYSSSNTAVATVSGSTVTIVGGGTTDITASQAGNGTYAAASNVIQTLTVNKQNQTITFGALSSKTDADAPFTVSPSSTSGLAVTLTSSNTAVALVSGSTITIVGAGTSTITASQAGNTIYNAATSVPQTLTVSSVMSVNQNLFFDFGPIEGTNGDATTNPDANGNYWNNISNAAGGTGWSTTYPPFTNLINSGNTNSGFTLAFTANGFTANGKLNGGLLSPYTSQFGSNSEFAIATATEDYIFTSNTSNGPVIKFSGLNTAKKYKFKIFGSRNTNIDRAAQYTLQGAGAPSVGTLQSSTATGLGGTVYINAATIYPTNLNVSYTLTSSGSNTQAVTYYGNNSTVYTSGLIEPDGTGAISLTTITTTPSSAYAYINCMKIEEYATAQTITFGAISTKNYGDADFAPGASASSGLSVSYTSSNTSVATIVSGQIHIVGVGTSTITALQAGDATYSPATNVSQTLTVDKKSLTAISSATASDKVYDGSTAAVITGTFTGIVGGDVVNLSGTFADANVGTGKTVTASSTLGGAQAAKYNFIGSLPGGLTASITATSVSVTGGNISASGISATDLPNTNLTVSSGELIINQASSVNALTVVPGAKLTLNSNQSLSVVSALTLQSDATGTATFVDNGGTLTAGSSNVEQYLTSGRNWYVSSPVSGAKSDVFSASSGNPLYWYDEAHGSTAPWATITNTTTDLTVMKGYVANMASSGVVTFTGTLNTGAQEIGLTQTSGQVKNGFNLVGNPYPSYLDWSSVTKTNLLTTMWYRTKTTPAPVTGATTYVFDTYNASGNISTSNGAKAVTNLIPPMQAFWVHVEQGFASSTLSVNNAQRSHADNSSNTFKAKASIEAQSVLRLEVSNGVNSDQALINFNSNASNGLDSYDSPKMSNESASIPEIYTMAGTEQVVINGVNDASELTLGFTTGEANNFTIKASQFANFASGTQIILRDNLLNYEQDLTLADYNFYSDVTANNETRFTVLFKAPSVATGINPNTTGNVWISINGNNQIVVNGASAETNVAVYNAVGQKILSDLTQLKKSLATGVYMVTVTNAGKSVTQKVIIK